ncbi:IclR family transcriptional regulator [Lysinibacillus sphaericus]|uniref:IclR family transcriptional regulator n=2 Tax=Lysinibacillus TaxID=400634 RepID=A0A2S0K3Y5_LYSSH|nr:MULTISPECIES: IclR family transcriptional regulator [Lysinibacillus]AVK98056.1 IclR family transcriptional regulator [Lysinibacillus sphaericus]MCS1380794.1 IclR family transcriptional regulator [Lysinibacillus sphaericus]MED4543559.1 IclR family transcriptional regulator [Lysinibacillus sphaericus]TKI19051.1 IclR family transcriptional regulator [Lysinibacillus sphaericus]TKI48443.1 IclR family transcriptional regulator [Lysinibacillus tabacifolii]
MQLLERAMTIAKVLASEASEGSLSISELSTKCDLPLSTLHRILKAMIAQGMIEQDTQTKHYRLGTIWMELGLQVYDTMDYISKIRPELERLAREVEESVYLSKPAGLDTIIIERIDSAANPIRIYDQLGIRIPMHIGAANKALLASLPTVEAKEIMQQLVPIDEMADLEAQLEQIRLQGFAISHGERTAGTSSVAVAVFNGFGEIIGAVSIGFVSFNVSEEHINFLTQRLVETGKRVSTKLGYRGK